MVVSRIVRKSTILKQIARRGIRWGDQSGVLDIVPKQNDVVLMYHSIGGGGYNTVPPTQFERQLEWIYKEYEIVDLPEILTPSQEKRAVLTFDDGYRSFYDSVLPILNEGEIPATVFVIGRTIEDSGFSHTGRTADESYLSREELNELGDHPLVHIGNHTMTHPNLTQITDESRLRAEIVDSANFLERVVGHPIERFCYPGNNWSKQVREVVSESHKVAVNGSKKCPPSQSDPYTIPRINGAVSVSELKFRCRKALR